MTTIDERIVAMKFDNAQFQSGVGETMGTLEKLKKGLSFGGMSTGVDSVTAKFSALGAVGFTVIQDLTQSIINFGKSTLSKVLDPIFDGGKDRALKIEQAKFQFRGLGQDVEASMASALEAVDGTAYGLEAAASVAAQFGATGMEAGEEMTAALRGVSGMAAMTGSSYEEIGQIFTTIAGEGKLSTMRMQQFATRGVNAAAVLAKEMGKTEAEVRKMVTNGEIGFREFAAHMNNAFGEHATKANETYTGSLSNMRSAFARIGADIQTPRLEAMRRVMNAFTPVINDVRKALGPAMEAWGEFTTMRADNVIEFLENIDLSALKTAVPIVVEGLQNLWDIASSVMGPIKEAFREVFPADQVPLIIRIAEAFRSVTEALKMGGPTLDAIKRIAKGFFSVFSIGWQIIKGVWNVVSGLFGAMSSGAGGLLDFVANIFDWISAIDQALKKGEVLSKFFEGLGAVLSVPVKFLSDLVGLLFGLATGASKAGSLSDLFSSINFDVGPIFSALGSFADKVKDFFGGIIQLLSPVVDFIKSIFNTFKDALVGAFETGDFSTVISTISALLQGGIFLQLSRLLKNGFGINFDMGGGFFAGVADTLGAVTDTLGAMQSKLKADALVSIGIALALLAGSLVLLAMVDSERLGGSLVVLGAALGSMVAAMRGMVTVLGPISTVKLPVIAASLALFAGAVLILSGALVLLSLVDMDSAVTGLVSLAGMLGILVKTLSALRGGMMTIIPISVGLIILSGAIYMLIGALQILGRTDSAVLFKGLSSLAIILGMLVTSARMLSKASGQMVRAAASIAIMALAINLLIPPIKLLGGMNTGELGQGLIALGVALGILVAAAALIPKNISIQGLGLILFATGLNVLAKAVSTMGELDWTTIAKGLAGIAGVLLTLTLAMRANPANMLAQGLAMVVIAAGLQMMGKAIAQMGSLSLAEMAKGLGLLAATLVVLGLALKGLSKIKTSVPTLIAIAVALRIFAGAMTMLGGMSIEQVLIGLGALAGALLVLGVAGLLMAPIIPVLTALSHVLMTMSIGFALLGASAVLFAGAMVLIVGTGAAGIYMISELLRAFAEELPKLMEGIALGIVAFAEIIKDGAPAVAGAAIAMFSEFIQGIISLIPQLAELIQELVFTILSILNNSIPAIITTGINILIALINGISANIGKLVTAAVNLVVNFINGISNNIGKIIQAGFDFIIAFLNGIADGIKNNMGPVVDAVLDIGTAIVEGVWNGIQSLWGWLWDKIAGFFSGIWNGVKDFFGISSPSKQFMWLSEMMMLGMGIGVDDHGPAVERKIDDFGHGIIDNLTETMSHVPDILDGLVDFEPTITPVLDLTAVEQEANRLSGLLPDPSISSDGSYGQASYISANRQAAQDNAADLATGSGGEGAGVNVTFEQNNYSPKSLSASDIYRNTRNQIAMAKEALNV